MMSQWNGPNWPQRNGTNRSVVEDETELATMADVAKLGTVELAVVEWDHANDNGMEPNERQ